MGRVLARIIDETPGCSVAGGLEPKGSALVGSAMGLTGMTISDDPAALFKKIDGIIDFTVPAATLSLVEFSAKAGIVHVIGTTGIDAAGDEKIRAAGKSARIVKSGNMSLGVNILASLVRKAAQALGEDFDIEVLEMHHRHKIDAPSGTALLLGKAAAEGRKIDLAKRSRAFARRPYGRKARGRHRLCNPARRFRRGRSHGDFRRQFRAHRILPQGREPRYLRPWRGEGGPLGARARSPASIQ